MKKEIKKKIKQDHSVDALVYSIHDFRKATEVEISLSKIKNYLLKIYSQSNKIIQQDAIDILENEKKEEN